MARGRVLTPRELPVHRSILFVRGVSSRPVPKVEVQKPCQTARLPWAPVLHPARDRRPVIRRANNPGVAARRDDPELRL